MNEYAVLYSELRREGFSHGEAMRHAGEERVERRAAAGPKRIAEELVEMLNSEGATEKFWKQLDTALGFAPGMDCLTTDMWNMLRSAVKDQDESRARGLLEDVANRYPEGRYEEFWAQGGSPQHDALMKVWDAEREAFTKARNASRRRALTDEDYARMRRERDEAEYRTYGAPLMEELDRQRELRKKQEEARERLLLQRQREREMYERGGGEPYA